MNSCCWTRKCLVWAVLAVIIIAAQGCSSTNNSAIQTPSNPASDQLVSYNGCKNTQSSLDAAQVSEGQECVEYSYDGSNTLSLTHINTAFNCCLESISADIQVQGNMISIMEYQHLQNGGCYCLCLYDVHYWLTNISPGTYHLRVARHQDTQVMDFSLNLTQAVHDQFCLQRTDYPWSQ